MAKTTMGQYAGQITEGNPNDCLSGLPGADLAGKAGYGAKMDANGKYVLADANGDGLRSIIHKVEGTYTDGTQTVSLAKAGQRITAVGGAAIAVTVDHLTTDANGKIIGTVVDGDIGIGKPESDITADGQLIDVRVSDPYSVFVA